MIDFVDLLNQRIYAKYQFSKGLLYWMDVVVMMVYLMNQCLTIIVHDVSQHE